MIIRKLDKYIEDKNERKYKTLEASILKNITWKKLFQVSFQKILLSSSLIIRPFQLIHTP